MKKKKEYRPISEADAMSEAARRFGSGSSRYYYFMASWAGLKIKGRFGGKKYRSEFGRGRRAR